MTKPPLLSALSGDVGLDLIRRGQVGGVVTEPFLPATRPYPAQARDPEGRRTSRNSSSALISNRAVGIGK